MTKTTIELTDEELMLLRDLLSHDIEVLAELVGYGDEDDGYIGPGGWTESLFVSTRTALGIGPEIGLGGNPGRPE